MKVGSKSLLWGVHQFVMHPIVVALAWRRLYGCWPDFDEWVAIFCHDIGYWGSPDLDGEHGWRHPERGAQAAGSVIYFFTMSEERAALAEKLALGHSATYCKRTGTPKSLLYWADKASILFEPWWFYRLRATLSGEINEYWANGPAGLTKLEWFRWLQNKQRKEVDL